MKKNTTNKAPENKSTERNDARLKWLSVDDMIASKVESENKVVFDLVAKTEGLTVATLTIYPSDRDFDNAILTLFGVSIRAMVRSGNNGMFLSLPSSKGKDGKYYDQVSVYDRDFHARVKELLGRYYAE